MNDPRVQRFQVIVAESHGRNGARSKILDQDIGDLDQLTDELFPLCCGSHRPRALPP